MLNERAFNILLGAVAVIGFVMVMVFAINAGNSASFGDLDQGTWKLETLVIDDVETAAIEGTQATIEFGDGRVAGSGGCNSYQGDYETDGPTIAVESIITTLKFCEDPAGVSDQEFTFLAHLGSADEFLIEDDRLILRADGTRLMLLTR